MSRNWIEVQVNTKLNFLSNALTVEELDTMLLSVLIRKQGIRLKIQRKINQRTGRRERISAENPFMLNKTTTHLKIQMKSQVKMEPLNFY